MDKIISWLHTKSDYNISEKNENKPWGAYWVIDSKEADRFEQEFFGSITNTKLPKTPKFLIVAPHQRLSLQTHARRNEKWKVFKGNVKAIVGEQYLELKEGDELFIPVTVQHRLIGTEDWSVVAEVWLHSDIHHPSDENDIIRIQDDFIR